MAEVFCRKLFQLDPESRDHYSDGLIEAKSHFSDAMNQLLETLQSPELKLQDLTAFDQTSVAMNALIYTLQQALGPDFTEETQTAWLTTDPLLTEQFGVTVD